MSLFSSSHPLLLSFALFLSHQPIVPLSVIGMSVTFLCSRTHFVFLLLFYTVLPLPAPLSNFPVVCSTCVSLRVSLKSCPNCLCYFPSLFSYLPSLSLALLSSSTSLTSPTPTHQSFALSLTLPTSSVASNGLEHLLPLHPGGHFLKVKLL